MIHYVDIDDAVKQKPPSLRLTKGVQGGGMRENGVGRDYCIPSSFRREHQFMVYLLPTTD